MDSIYRLRDTYINLADIKKFSLTAANSHEPGLRSITITGKEDGPVKIDFKDREEAEKYCKELDKAWGKHLLAVPRQPSPGIDYEKLEELFERNRPLRRFDDIFCYDEEIHFSVNPFTEFLFDNLYESNSISEKCMAAAKQYLEDGMKEVKADPAQLLNFDFSLYPDHLYMMIPLNESRLDGYYEFFCVKRMADNLYFELQIDSQHTRDTSVLNPRLLMKNMMKESMGSALTCYDEFYYHDEDDMDTQFYYTHVGGGNMYAAYNRAFAVLEAIYHKALEELKTEAKKIV